MVPWHRRIWATEASNGGERFDPLGPLVRGEDGRGREFRGVLLPRYKRVTGSGNTLIAGAYLAAGLTDAVSVWRSGSSLAGR